LNSPNESKANIRILVIRLSSLGDVMLTEPLVRALRAKYPEAQIDFVVRTEYADVLRNIAGISRLFLLDVSQPNALRELRGKLKHERYTHVLDLHNNFRSRALRKLPAAKLSVIDKRSLKRWLLVKFKINLLKDAPDIVGRYFEVARGLGIVDDRSAPMLTNTTTAIPTRVAIAPGSRHWNKQWPEEYFIELVRKFIAEDYTVDLLGSNDEAALASRIVSAVNSSNVTNYAGRLSIAESIEQLKQASFAVTNDSGLMHICAALGIRTVAIFGPTVREFGFMPRAVNVTIVENAGLYCRPCTAIGRDDCPEKHFRCMREICVEEVIANSVSES